MYAPVVVYISDMKKASPSPPSIFTVAPRASSNAIPDIAPITPMNIITPAITVNTTGFDFVRSTTKPIIIPIT